MNKKGTISSKDINLDNISKEIFSIYKPLLIEMENFNENLDKDEFIQSSLALIQSLDYIKK